MRYTHAILSSALKQAVELWMLAQNPAAFVELPRQSRKEMKALSPEQAGRFLAAAAEDRWNVLFMLALTTGMRPGEFFALQWKDIDLDRGSLTVQRALVWKGEQDWYFTEPKTSRSRRTIPLPQSVVRGLVEHKRRQAEVRIKAGPNYANHDLVFATGTGTPLMLGNIVRKHFKPVLERAGLPAAFRLYDLRRSCATLLLFQNEHPKVVSERLGHANITLTLDTYTHVLPQMQQAATAKLESLLFTKGSGAK